MLLLGCCSDSKLESLFWREKRAFEGDDDMATWLSRMLVKSFSGTGALLRRNAVMGWYVWRGNICVFFTAHGRAV